MVDIKIKRLTNTAKIPTKAHDTDACYDIYVDEPDMTYSGYDFDENTLKHVTATPGIRIPAHGSVALHTGFATSIPQGYYCPVYARSGMGIKKNLRPSNCVGVIDANYRGEWMVALFNDGNVDQIIHHGDRVAQFAVLPVIESELTEVTELDETDRGTGGFGSTGVK